MADSSHRRTSQGGKPQAAEGRAPVTRKQLPAIGRNSHLHYCERCGRKRKVCRCDVNSDA